MISMHLPLLPVPFSRPWSNGSQRFNSPKYAKFRKQLSLLMKAQYSKEPLTGAIDVRVIFSLLKPKTSKNNYPVVRPDIDNFLKSVLDSANGILFIDDCQVTRVTMEKRYSEHGGITLLVKRDNGFF